MYLKTITIKREIFSLLFVFLSFMTMPLYAANKELSLNNYLEQVRVYNCRLKSSELTARGAHQRIGEGKLLTRPRLFAEGQYVTNSYNSAWSPIAGTSDQLQSYQVGLSQMTPYGVQGKLYYNYQKQNLHGVSPLLDQPNTAISSSPMLEVTVPLGRNWAGRETRASMKLLDSQARLTHFSEKFKITQLLAEAESTYWRLAITRAIVDIQRDSLQRAIKIDEWTLHRVNLHLAENADTLQAVAAVEAKKLDLEVALNDEIVAARAFNTLRGSCQNCVPEHLCSYQGAVQILLPERVGPRDDVKAAKAEEQIAIANAQLGIEKNKPNIDLFANYSLNGTGPDSTAISDSFTTSYPSTAVGLRLSVPLDIGCLAQIRSGYRKEVKGAKALLQQKIYEDHRGYEDLTIKLNNAHKRLDLASRLECIQAKKLQAEKERLKFGKTTTYQVLMFEQDYANAQIARLVIQNEMYSLIAQLKTYEA